MTRVLAIDPGPTESAYTLIESDDCSIIAFDKADNDALLEHLDILAPPGTLAAIEMVESYGMAVGREVFETVVWIGRYEQRIRDLSTPVDRIGRKIVKSHLCQSTKATDANISQALKDRFAYGIGNHGKGTKAAPGWFYGFTKDVWQAYALAVVKADQIEGRQ